MKTKWISRLQKAQDALNDTSTIRDDSRIVFSPPQTDEQQDHSWFKHIVLEFGFHDEDSIEGPVGLIETSDCGSPDQDEFHFVTIKQLQKLRDHLIKVLPK